MKKLALFTLIFCISFAVYSQATKSINGGFSQIYINSTYTTNIPVQKTAPLGSVYLADDWTEATIVLKDSSYVSGVEANYNYYSKYVEINDNGTTRIINLSKIEWLILSNQDEYKFYANGIDYYFDYPDIGQTDLVEVLAQGSKASFIDKLYLDVIYANYNTAVDAGSTSDTYVIKHEYYIIKDDEVIKIRKSKGFILNIFSDKRPELKQYIKTNNLKMRKTQDIAQVVNYYNSLYDQSAN